VETLILYKCGHTESYIGGTPQIMDDYKQTAKSQPCPKCESFHHELDEAGPDTQQLTRR